MRTRSEAAAFAAGRASKRIFSGPGSREMWGHINLARNVDEDVWLALYLLGCKCQELEAEVATQRSARAAGKGER